MRRISGNLSLSDESTWSIQAVDPRADESVSCLIDAMNLNLEASEARITNKEHHWKFFVSSLTGRDELNDDPSSTLAANAKVVVDTRRNNRGHGGKLDWKILSSSNEKKINCIFNGEVKPSSSTIEAMIISSAIAYQAQERGAMLIHGALLQRDGRGVILAGPGGVGKSTAAASIPPPWLVCSDDMTLIVRDPLGDFWAHPWPTWSRFIDGGVGGTWDVQSALPLKAIFFIRQAEQDQSQATGEGEALCLSLEVVEQSSRLIYRGMGVQERRVSNLIRYENVAQLTKSVPCFKLGISKDGAFWREIERACDLVNP